MERLHGLSLSPDGHLLAFASGAEVRLIDTAGGGERTIAAPGWAELVAFDDEVWVLDRAGLLARWSRAGEAIGDPAELVPGRLIGAPTGTPSAALMGELPMALVRDCGELVVEALRPQPDLVVPLGGRDWLLVLDGRLCALRGGTLQALPAAPDLTGIDVLSASALAPGAAVLVVSQQGRRALLVVDVASGEQRRRCDLGDATEVRVAAQRGHAFVLHPPGDLTVIDLRFGKALRTFSDTRAIQDFAIDARAHTLAVVADGAVGWTATRALFERQAEPAPLTSAALPVRPLAVKAAPAPAVSEAAPDSAPAPLPVSRPAVRSAAGPLRGLTPRDATAVARGPVALRHLERHLSVVGAWAKRAVCEGWDSGRLAFASATALPFEHELGALVDGESGRATDRLARARAEAAVVERLHDEALASPEQPPLAALAAELGLSPVATDILLVVAAPAIWGELARLYAIVANDKERPLCDEWLVAVLLSARTGRREIAAALDPEGPLVRSGLIRIGAGERPFASLSAHPLVARILYGEDFQSADGDAWVQPRDAERRLRQLVLSCDLGPLLAGLAKPTPARVVVRGGVGSGRTSLLAALAARAGRRLGLIDLTALTGGAGAVAMEDNLAEALRRCLLRGWLPCVTGADSLPGADPGLGERLRDLFRAHAGPLLFRCGRHGTPSLDPGYLVCDLAPLSESERLATWQSALERRGLPDGCAESLASRFLVGPGVIERVIAAAEVPDEHTDVEAVMADGLRQHRDGRMSQLAQRVTRLATWSSLVLPPDVIDSVRELIGRVQHRRTVFEQWGFDRVMTTSRGLTALFEGGPGTGKTMVAGVIARELGCDLYRIDLSSVMSKWVGETERNLGALFDAAEDGQAILLFDEADSLFARRTEVKSSNDRFANLEVNYLLQRLDAFEGIAILTTNLGGAIDPAFKRRLSLRLSFPFPDEEMREQLWRAHLPAELPMEGPLELGELARKYALSGGYIRNVTLRAAFLAAHEGQRLAHEHLERAIALEYREMGKLISSGTLE